MLGEDGGWGVGGAIGNGYRGWGCEVMGDETDAAVIGGRGHVNVSV